MYRRNVFFFPQQLETSFSGRFIDVPGFHCYTNPRPPLCPENYAQSPGDFLATISIHRGNMRGNRARVLR